MPLGANKAAIMGVAGVSAAGDVVLLATTTADDDATISFTSGITSTYGEYIFKCYNMNPATNDQYFAWQGSTDGGSNYNVTITSTAFTAYQNESGTSNALTYRASEDQAQGTAFQEISGSVGNAADKSNVVELHLFNPASTTYVKHWYSTSNAVNGDGTPTFNNEFMGGYFNTTSAINAVQFKFESGNINEGTIKMWGVK